MVIAELRALSRKDPREDRLELPSDEQVGERPELPVVAFGCGLSPDDESFSWRPVSHLCIPGYLIRQEAVARQERLQRGPECTRDRVGLFDIEDVELVLDLGQFCRRHSAACGDLVQRQALTLSLGGKPLAKLKALVFTGMRFVDGHSLSRSKYLRLRPKDTRAKKYFQLRSNSVQF
jgi:hypothetical protein